MELTKRKSMDWDPLAKKEEIETKSVYPVLIRALVTVTSFIVRLFPNVKDKAILEKILLAATELTVESTLPKAIDDEIVVVWSGIKFSVETVLNVNGL